MEITRKQFLGGTAAAMTAAALGCASDDSSADGEDTGGGMCDGDVAGSIASNHGHEATVPLADIEAGAAHDYDITGTASHSHTLTVSAGNMTKIAGGQSVMVTSSSAADGHNHVVTLAC